MEGGCTSAARCTGSGRAPVRMPLLACSSTAAAIASPIRVGAVRAFSPGADSQGMNHMEWTSGQHRSTANMVAPGRRVLARLEDGRAPVDGFSPVLVCAVRKSSSSTET